MGLLFGGPIGRPNVGPIGLTPTVSTATAPATTTTTVTIPTATTTTTAHDHDHATMTTTMAMTVGGDCGTDGSSTSSALTPIKRALLYAMAWVVNIGRASMSSAAEIPLHM